MFRALMISIAMSISVTPAISAQLMFDDQLRSVGVSERCADDWSGDRIHGNEQLGAWDSIVSFSFPLDPCSGAVGTAWQESFIGSVGITFLTETEAHASQWPDESNASSNLNALFRLDAQTPVQLTFDHSYTVSSGTGASARNRVQLRYCGSITYFCDSPSAVDVNLGLDFLLEDIHQTSQLVLGPGFYRFNASAEVFSGIAPYAPGHTSAFSHISFSLAPAVVPAPASVWLFGSALGLMGLVRRKIGS
jgi:hypothetical protein